MLIYSIQILVNSLHFSLHHTASRAGNIIYIPRVPLSTFCQINRLINGPELESFRHSKLCFDLARPLTNQNLQYCRGTLSYKMPSRIHDLLAQFASLLQQKMWNNGSEGSFYPPDVKQEQFYISDSRSTGTVQIHCLFAYSFSSCLEA